MTDLEYIDYSEMMRDARRGLEREREQLEEKMDAMSGYLKILDATERKAGIAAHVFQQSP